MDTPENTTDEYPELDILIDDLTSRTQTMRSTSISTTLTLMSSSSKIINVFSSGKKAK